MNEELRLLLIKENGNIVSIFSDINMNECTYECSLDEFDSIEKFYDKNVMKEKVIVEKCADRHLFYLKEYLKNNFVDEFKNLKINPQAISEDLILYMILADLGVVTIINSVEHINLLIVPKKGVTEEQLKSIEQSGNLFNKNLLWEMNQNMHLEIIDGMGMPDYGEETCQGKLSDLVSKINVKKVKKR